MEFSGLVTETKNPEYIRVANKINGKTASAMVPRETVTEEFSYGDTVTVILKKTADFDFDADL